MALRAVAAVLAGGFALAAVSGGRAPTDAWSAPTPNAVVPSAPAAAAPLPGSDVPTAEAIRAVAPAAARLGGADRALLRAVFGVDDPDRLYASDSSGRGVLLYDAVPTGCAPRGRDPATRPAGRCQRVAVRVGFTAARRPGETWDAFVARVVRSGTRAWPDGARHYYTGLASLDPEARPAFERLVADARRAGFALRVGETYRSPARQALLLARGDGRTATATSVHSYGRAVDLVVGDGRIDRPATAREWIRFRRWVVRYRGGMFRVIGTPERTWDWPHVELARPLLGFRSVPALVATARACRAAADDAAAAAARCTIAPNLPPHLSQHAEAEAGGAQ